MSAAARLPARCWDVRRSPCQLTLHPPDFGPRTSAFCIVSLLPSPPRFSDLCQTFCVAHGGLTHSHVNTAVPVGASSPSLEPSAVLAPPRPVVSGSHECLSAVHSGDCRRSVYVCRLSPPPLLKIHCTRHHFVAKQITTSSDPASLQTGPRCASVVKFLKLLHVDFED